MPDGPGTGLKVRAGVVRLFAPVLGAVIITLFTQRWRNLSATISVAAGSNETIRIISLRKATNEERQDYETAIDDGLEAN